MPFSLILHSNLVTNFSHDIPTLFPHSNSFLYHLKLKPARSKVSPQRLLRTIYYILSVTNATLFKCWYENPFAQKKIWFSANSVPTFFIWHHTSQLNITYNYTNLFQSFSNKQTHRVTAHSKFQIPRPCFLAKIALKHLSKSEILCSIS